LGNITDKLAIILVTRLLHWASRAASLYVAVTGLLQQGR